MKFELYVIYDRIAGVYSNPRVQHNKEDAIRTFKYMTNNQKDAEPSDYELYYIGTFDTKSGNVVALDKPEFVIKGGEIVG